MTNNKATMLPLSDIPAPFPGCTQMHALYRIVGFGPVDGIVTTPCYRSMSLSEELGIEMYATYPQYLYHKRTRIFDRNDTLVEEHNSYFNLSEYGWYEYTKKDMLKMLEEAYENR